MMSFLLFIGLLILGFLLQDTRKRLKRTETLLRALELEQERLAGTHREQAPLTPRASPWQPAQTAIPPEETAQRAPSMPLSAQPTAEPAAEEPVSEERAPEKPWIAEPLTPADPVTNPAAEPDIATAAYSAPMQASQEETKAGTGAAAKTDTAPARPGLSVPRISFEDLFGRKLPIWAGGVTLAVAGVLLVKYSIDAGLLSPAIRVICGLIFGGGLIAGAEAALRQRHRVGDDRVHQALSGAGIASLYASILAAVNLYDLVGAGTAFAGLVMVTALAMGLSLRFGAPSAVLGLAGGVAAPALVSATEPNVPLLCTYLALAMGGLGALSRKQRWLWLGIGALLGGAGWGMLLILSGGLDFVSTLSVGMLVLIAGIAVPALAFPRSAASLLRGGGALIAAAQIAALVATGGFAPLEWGLYGLVSVAILWLAHREAGLRMLPAIGLATGLLLSAIWPAPPLAQFVPVLLAMTILYGGGALMRLWKPGGGMMEAGQPIALALGGFAVAWLHFHHDTAQDMAFVLLALAAAALPAAAAWMGWTHAERREDARLASLCAASALMLAIAGLVGLPPWLVPVLLAALAAGLLFLSLRAEDRRMAIAARAFFAAAALALPVSDTLLHQFERLVQDGPQPAPAQALLRWAALALCGAFFAWRAQTAKERTAFQVIAAGFTYGALAQIIPAPWLAIAAAAALGLLAEANRKTADRALFLPAMATCAAIILLWALEPWTRWSGAALLSLRGEPPFASDLPVPLAALQHLLAPAALVLAVLWRERDMLLTRREGKAAAIIAAGGLIAGLHIGYKQIFAIADTAAFTRFGLAERTLWEGLLLAAGYGIWRWGTGRGRPQAAGRGRLQTDAALALIGVGVAHSAVYTLLLHNPLWSAQAVGLLPLANLLIPAFGMIFAGLWLAERIDPDRSARLSRPFDGARMAAIILFAFASLRHLFTGTLLVGVAVGPVENILWSVLAILLAIGFLLWGIRTSARDWRIASLVLMIGAVAKVFLLDASGLEGLLRIVSFLALGFSLIGIGWLYSRYLRKEV
ncbi:MAG: DUF2339 domain-containing protein [Sphingobium sp.]